MLFVVFFIFELKKELKAKAKMWSLMWEEE